MTAKGEEKKEKRPGLKERIAVLRGRLVHFIAVLREGLTDFTALTIAMLTTTLLPILIFLLIIIAAVIVAAILFG